MGLNDLRQKLVADRLTHPRPDSSHELPAWQPVIEALSAPCRSAKGLNATRQRTAHDAAEREPGFTARQPWALASMAKVKGSR